MSAYTWIGSTYTQKFTVYHFVVVAIYDFFENSRCELQDVVGLPVDRPGFKYMYWIVP